MRSESVNSFIWSAIERFSVQAVRLLVQIIIARILSPSDFGIIGMVAVFIEIAQTFIDSGFSKALIRKQDRTEKDNSTAFFFNIGIGVIAYLLIFVLAPTISNFYNSPLLVPILRVVALNVLFNSLSVVQIALLTANLDFKTIAKASLLSAVISGVIGIYMAYVGHGVWALAIQTVSSGAINTILIWVMAKWRPVWCFSKDSFMYLFGFGSKLLASGLIDTVYRNAYTIVIGKVFSSTELGYYSKASQFSQFPSSNLMGILQRVSFPILCQYQTDITKLSVVYRKYLKLSAYLIFPLMVGLAVVADPFISVVLSDKWSAAIPLLQLLCLAMMWYPIHAINLNLLQVIGRSDLFLKLEVVKKIFGVIILVVSIPFGVKWMCAGQIVSSIISFLINTHYTGKLINVGLFVQLKDLLPSVLYSAIMALGVYIVGMCCENDIIKLFTQICSGCIIYLGISRITHSGELEDLIIIVRRK